MLATILKSKIASDVTVSIIRTFASMRKLINSNDFYLHQLKELEKRQLTYEIKSDKNLIIFLMLLKINNKDHFLKGKLIGFREFHISGNLLVVYMLICHTFESNLVVEKLYQKYL